MGELDNEGLTATGLSPRLKGLLDFPQLPEEFIHPEGTYLEGLGLKAPDKPPTFMEYPADASMQTFAELSALHLNYTLWARHAGWESERDKAREIMLLSAAEILKSELWREGMAAGKKNAEARDFAENDKEYRKLKHWANMCRARGKLLGEWQSSFTRLLTTVSRRQSALQADLGSLKPFGPPFDEPSQ